MVKGHEIVLDWGKKNSQWEFKNGYTMNKFDWIKTFILKSEWN